ncbi:hypothetical protein M413DRAFT_28570 [Hebeloma cylindrosporum]|uniref:Uncharacterized protein n=1 Tax=Hebeloma cylindrosporum TaxID=76867 RepID=A0A0C2YG07_HEBCY|nr:hypothetical protein M413DRAFT_28570 [Hebeloma cylindrosporum h7]
MVQQQLVQLPNMFFLRLQYDQQVAIAEIADAITEQCEHLRATDFRNVEPDDPLMELLPQYTANLAGLGEALAMAKALHLNHTISDQDAVEIARTLKHTNQYSCHKILRRQAIEAFGSLLTARQAYRFLMMSLLPVIIDPANAAANPEDPPVVNGESYCITEMISRGSASYEALQHGVNRVVEMTEFLMGVYEGEKEMKDKEEEGMKENEEKGERKGNAIEIDE